MLIERLIYNTKYSIVYNIIYNIILYQKNFLIFSLKVVNR